MADRNPADRNPAGINPAGMNPAGRLMDMTASEARPHPRTTRRRPPRMDVYRFIIDYKRRSGGDSPTRREIMDALSITSTSLVSNYLETLAMAGLIRIGENDDGTRQARGIEVVGGRWYAPGEVDG